MTTLVVPFADQLRHYLNPMHVYCRLCELGIRAETAMWIVRKYEAIYVL